VKSFHFNISRWNRIGFNIGRLDKCKRMSDPIDDAYEKLLGPHTDAEIEAKITCPKCNSDNVDRKAGYRGEYRCLECGYYWQVGGFNAT